MNRNWRGGSEGYAVKAGVSVIYLGHLSVGLSPYISGGRNVSGVANRATNQVDAAETFVLAASRKSCRGLHYSCC
jgi:hypothetical protein